MVLLSKQERLTLYREWYKIISETYTSFFSNEICDLMRDACRRFGIPWYDGVTPWRSCILKQFPEVHLIMDGMWQLDAGITIILEERQASMTLQADILLLACVIDCEETQTSDHEK